MNAWPAAGLTTSIAGALLEDVMRLDREELAVDDMGGRCRWSTFLVMVARTVDDLRDRMTTYQIPPMERARAQAARTSRGR